ncbi:MAG: CAP domain-containing protein [Oscillospiraceae bacterium]|nr:CAP domain-containing protein [Oscillospiraceae bacterium]
MIKKIVLIFVAAVMLSIPLSASAEITASVPQFWTDNEWEVLRLTNIERAKVNLTPLSIFDTLQRAANVRSAELKTVFSHNRPDGSVCFTVLSDLSISNRTAGENIARGQRSPSAVMQSWMDSQGHKENILTADFSHIGTGYADVNNWVQVFVGSCETTVSGIGTTSANPILVTGRDINELNLILILSCDSHGASYMPLIADMCKGYDKNSESAQSVTITYGKQNYTFALELSRAFTTNDALTVLRAAAGTVTLTPEQTARYDLNGDGVISSADALMILKMVAGV